MAAHTAISILYQTLLSPHPSFMCRAKRQTPLTIWHHGSVGEVPGPKSKYRENGEAQARLPMCFSSSDSPGFLIPSIQQLCMPPGEKNYFSITRSLPQQDDIVAE